jgi:acetyl-CoA acetyltransferase
MWSSSAACVRRSASFGIAGTFVRRNSGAGRCEGGKETKMIRHGWTNALWGLVVAAGLGQNPARGALGGGLADTVGPVTINKVCGCGLKTSRWRPGHPDGKC